MGEMKLAKEEDLVTAVRFAQQGKQRGQATKALVGSMKALDESGDEALKQFAGAGSHRSREQNGSANASAKVGVQVSRPDSPRGDAPGVVAQIFHLHAQAFDEMSHVAHVPNTRHIMEDDRLLGQQAGRQQRQGRVLIPTRRNIPAQGNAAFDHKFFHGVSCEISAILRQFAAFAKHITIRLHPFEP